MNKVDVLVIGGGPAGLAAAEAAAKKASKVMILEREERLGGILKQCIHDGFGLLKFSEKLSGCEYAERYIDMVEKSKNIDIILNAFVSNIKKIKQGFKLEVSTNKGMQEIYASAIVIATGCRERTAKQVNINGTRPAGVLTAGVAQHYINLLGGVPFTKCVILGSGDIGLIMARRATLEGAKVVGVYEAKPTPSGLTRNIHQCLNDYGIPLHLSHTVTKVFGETRLQAVEVCRVDEKMQPIKGTEQIIECDGLMLSVGLIPENEIAEKLGVEIDPATKGAKVDEAMMTSVEGVFSSGNALHVHDLVDYVSESAEIAGENAAKYSYKQTKNIEVEKEGFLYLVPQKINVGEKEKKVPLFFRAKRDLDKAKLTIWVDGEEVYNKKLTYLKPPEMVKLEPLIPPLNQNSHVKIKLEER